MGFQLSTFTFQLPKGRGDESLAAAPVCVTD
jgi:hypothetical protein